MGNDDLISEMSKKYEQMASQQCVNQETCKVKMVRGGEGDENEIIPPLPPSIVLVHSYKENDDEDDEDDEDEKVPVYEPNNVCYTKFANKSSPKVILKKIEEHLKTVPGYKFKPTGYVLDVSYTQEDWESEIKFVVNIFSHKDSTKSSIIECRRRKGNNKDFRNVYAALRSYIETS